MRIHVLVLAIATVLAPPFLSAQETGHSTDAPAAGTAQTRRHDHAQHGAAGTAAEDHAAMDHSKMDHSKMDHSKMDHSKMDHSKMDHGTSGLREPRTPIPAITDADRAAAFPADVHDMHMHGRRIDAFLRIDRLEAFDADPGPGQAWEAKGWIGGDVDRLWLRSEGERVRNRLESADLELLWGHGVTPWWDFVAGVRHDFKPGDSRTFAAIGVQGLAPQKFEVSATAYLGQGGQTAARFEAEYELLLTNRWVLQPRLEAEWFGKDDPLRHTGSGLATAEAGLRLRYEFTRQFAPYVGVVHERAFGDTADYRRHESGKARETRLVVGLRTWF